LKHKVLELSNIAGLGICSFAILTERAIGTPYGKTHVFKTRVMKVKTSEGK